MAAFRSRETRWSETAVGMLHVYETVKYKVTICYLAFARAHFRQNSVSMSIGLNVFVIVTRTMGKQIISNRRVDNM